ncbi:MAG: protein kinase [Planctomycetes bacterium]|nr:protein kinase [Planctomycetota bacterium]
MSSDPSFLLGLLAVATQCVTPEQWEEALAARRAVRDLDIGEWLVDRGWLTPRAQRALAVVVEERAWKHPDGTVLASPETLLVGEVAVTPSTLPLTDKFRLGAELGRGGLGRVVEAEDGTIGRTVALKLLREDAPEEALERFRWEARVTGRLEHPNVVPVHEVGRLPDGREFFCMKRIAGRDMAEAIREGKWPLRRLVEAFRDVCGAVAYAHWKGVIHRDLKPANVMLGDFGEVLVVDWGLAKEQGGRAEGREGGKATLERGDGVPALSPSGPSALTLDGDLMGTPAYMPPEQAAGRLSELDARSDVWSLGAILYEILAGRPPFVGEGALEVARRVVEEPVAPPSSVRACPPDLEAICLKALSKKKEDRYASAVELELEIEQFLEGTKERERREAQAAAEMARARERIAACARLGAEARGQAECARQKKFSTESWEPLEKKREIWQAEDRATELENLAAEAFSEGEALLTSVLAAIPDHAEARRLRAELHWRRFLEAEEAQDRKGMVLSRRIAERHNDGALDEALSGLGTVEVRASAYSCACLRDGRDVEPGELGVLGYHPWSGRKFDEGRWASLTDLEPRAPLRLRVHRAACAASPVAGAEAWAYRYEEIDRVLVPASPAGSGPPGSAELLDALFGNSPLRPRGPGVYLGRTPVSEQRLPAGSWLLVAAAPGFRPARVPFLVKRQERVAVAFTLYRPTEVPDGHVLVAGGPFRIEDSRKTEGEWVPAGGLDDVLVARFPVTAREYAAWLRALHAVDPAAAAARRPRLRAGPPLWPCDPVGGPLLPTAEVAARRPAPARQQEIPDGIWDPEWPVFGISWDDAMAYAHAASLCDGRVYHLPHEAQWERAARGVDGRPWAFGPHFDEVYAAVLGSLRNARAPERIDSRPFDESPYGARDTVGHVTEHCLNHPGGPMDWRLLRGGSFNRNATTSSAVFRSGSVHSDVPDIVGIRLACEIRLSEVAPSRS